MDLKSDLFLKIHHLSHDSNIVLSIFQPNQQERTLLQFHYTEWPCHTCPFSNAILEFRRRMRAVVGSRMEQEGPIIVHCKYVHSEQYFTCKMWISELLVAC